MFLSLLLTLCHMESTKGIRSERKMEILCTDSWKCMPFGNTNSLIQLNIVERLYDKYIPEYTYSWLPCIVKTLLLRLTAGIRPSCHLLSNCVQCRMFLDNIILKSLIILCTTGVVIVMYTEMQQERWPCLKGTIISGNSYQW